MEVRFNGVDLEDVAFVKLITVMDDVMRGYSRVVQSILTSLDHPISVDDR